MELRLEALKRIDKGESLKSIALSYGVGESTVSDWKKKRKEIEEFCCKLDTKGALESRSTIKKPKLEKLDDALLLWFKQERANGKPISGPIVKEKAVLLHKKMGGNEDFVASEGWLNRWKKRHGIHVLSICGEKLSSNSEEAAKFKKKFEELLKEKDLSKEQVYNVDETGLYYRMLPTKTLASRKEAAAPGYKKGKDRVTVSLCSNASGTHKLPVMLIGKSAKPRAFKNINIKSLPVHYRASKTAWMNEKLFKEWFHCEFVPSVKKHLQSLKMPLKALLLLDNAPSHPSEEELRDGDIVAVFLPPNVTALIQPMDQGVIESVKRRYRRKLLTSLIEKDGENASVIDLLKKMNIKDVVYMIAESWLELPESTLINSWHKIWSNEIEEEMMVAPAELCSADFISAFKHLDGCQDVDTEDVDQWLAVDKDLQEETLSDEDIVAAVVTDGIQDDDDDDDFVETATSVISHTNGMRALETALCYVEQQPSASPMDVMLIKQWRNYAANCRSSKLKQKKVTDFFNGV